MINDSNELICEISLEPMELKIDTDLGIPTYISTDLPKYEGETEIIPTNTDIILPTKDTQIDEDITVKGITGTKQINITENGTITENVANYGNAEIITSVVNQDYEDALVAFGVEEELANSIEAMTNYSNEVTGESDTTLSDAVRTLADGFVDELYNVWTDIIGRYLGRNMSNGLGLFTPNSIISNATGEVITAGGNAVCEAYLPVDESYTYIKNGYRIYGIWCYDKNKNYLGNVVTQLNNLTYGQILPTFIPGTKYIRVATHNVTNNWALAIIRIA